MDVIFSYAGIIASVWIVIGIYIASRFYPNYSHLKQFCSELGAFGSPTQKLSPVINNYPLGALLVVFGYYLIIAFQAHLPTVAIGVMVIVHGICTWVCGFFPMDADAYTQYPSKSCKIHSWSGLIMLASFIIAPLIVAFSSYYPLPLRVFSVVCVLGCFYFSYRLAKAFKIKTVPGLHQRLSYGFQILWLFVYSLCVVAKA
ncbi:DUF998 domain-containing protein [Aliiglaciecola sp. NS0011-25]|uniref:DUF998 domain-containing protein n=1 Tax=Aliiglaciecola sp. NS0011-25 TaxID=3127654 RepID=UPI00333F5420